MKTFVRVTEVWIPSRDRTALELGEGAYGDLHEFGAQSRGMRFAFDEGLPGRAWSARRPLLLRAFEDSYFLRTQAAHRAGLSVAVTIPIFAGDVLTAVVVLFCGNAHDLSGAIEIWEDQEGDARELRLTEGFYGCARAFEWVSRSTTFRHGHGLPGLVSASGMPQLMADLGRSAHFLRADAAVRAGIEHGIGIPCGRRSGASSVVTLLSGYETPIARRMEIWAPNEDRTQLTFLEGYCDVDPDHAMRLASVSVPFGEGPIGRPARTGVPVVVEKLAEGTHIVEKQASAMGLTSLLSMPVLEDGAVRAIIAMYF